MRPRTVRAGAALAALLALLAALPVPAQSPGSSLVRETFYDLTLPVAVDEMAFINGCGGGDFDTDPAADWFRYLEVDDGSVTPPNSPPGYFDTGCGTATLNAPVPPGTDHVHVRFRADRTVQFAGGASPAQNATFVQEVRVGDGAGEQEFTYYNRSEGSSPPRQFDVPRVALAPGAQAVEVAWYFEDTGVASLGALSLFFSGASYSSRVDNATVEFSSVPADAHTSDHRERSGTVVLKRSRVDVDVPAALLDTYGVDLRTRVDPRLSFSHLETPNGTRFGLATTRDAGGPTGYDRQRILIEHFDAYEQVSISSDLMVRFGPGSYRLVFEQVSDVQPQPALIPLAGAMLLLPLPFGLVALSRVRHFEREAFGRFRRSAARLRLSVVLVMAYYLAVLVSAFFGGRLELMAALPLRAEAWFLYGQAVLAILAFLVLYLVARELYRITRPSPEAEHSP